MQVAVQTTDIAQAGTYSVPVTLTPDYQDADGYPLAESYYITVNICNPAANTLTLPTVITDLTYALGSGPVTTTAYAV